MVKALSAGWGVIRTLLHYIGRVVTVILLTVVYVVVFVPLGLVLRLVGRTPLLPREALSSTWKQRAQEEQNLEAARRPY
jgi:hypothetical protein